MIRMSKLTDYGIVLLTHMAIDRERNVHTAHELAAASHVPLPTVSKILKELSKAGLVVSHRGRRGGYTLARPPDDISVSAIISALEGPIGLTECTEAAGICGIEAICPAKSHWGEISRAIQRTLDRLPLSALGPPHRRPSRPAPILSTTGMTP